MGSVKSDVCVLRLGLLGPLAATSGGEVLPVSSRKGRALLAYLARRKGERVPRDTLAGLLWSDSPNEQARASLRSGLTALRRNLGHAADALTADAEAVTLEAGAVEIDVDRFLDLARGSDRSSIESAAELGQGAFLEGLGTVTPEFDRWMAAERAMLEAEHGAVMLRLCDLAVEAGAQEEVIAIGQKMLAQDPFQEHVHRRVMRACLALGRPDAALRQFETLADILKRDLGVQPDSATQAVASQARAQRRGEAAPVREAPAATTPAVPERPSLAVLRFRALGSAEEDGFFGEGLSEDLIVDLSRESELMVVARQSSFRFSAEDMTAGEIGETLGVRYIVGGSVRIAGERLRVTAHLVRCADGAELWAERFDRPMADIFDVQIEIAATVTATVIGHIRQADASATLARPLEALGGYALVARGLRHMNTFSAEDHARAEDCFQRATEAAPTFARAWGLLALARLYRRWSFDMDTETGPSEEAAQRALSLDQREARAHCALGMANMIRRRFDRAAHHFSAGLEINPNDDLLLTEYGRFLMYDDRPEEGLRRIREAMRLNPFHPSWYWGMQGRCLHTLGRYAEAIEAFEQVQDPPFYTHAYIAACHRALGQDDAAEAAVRRLREARSDFDLDRFASMFPYRNEETARRFLTTLREAGLG